LWARYCCCFRRPWERRCSRDCPHPPAGPSLLAYIVLSGWSRRERTAAGLRNETLEWTDDSPVPSPTLRSKKYGLVGRPDQLVRVGKVLVPIEQKPRARRLQPSHILQVAAHATEFLQVVGGTAWGVVGIRLARHRQYLGSELA
jgi:hypothetical protein